MKSMITKRWQVLAANRATAGQWLRAVGDVAAYACGGAPGHGQSVPLADHMAKSYFHFSSTGYLVCKS